MTKVKVIIEIDDAISRNGRITTPISVDGDFVTDFIIWDDLWLERLNGVNVSVVEIEDPVTINNSNINITNVDSWDYESIAANIKKVLVSVEEVRKKMGLS